MLKLYFIKKKNLSMHRVVVGENKTKFSVIHLFNTAIERE